MSIYTYIFAMAVTTYLIRMLPLTVFRKPIKSREERYSALPIFIRRAELLRTLTGCKRNAQC